MIVAKMLPRDKLDLQRHLTRSMAAFTRSILPSAAELASTRPLGDDSTAMRSMTSRSLRRRASAASFSRRHEMSTAHNR